MYELIDAGKHGVQTDKPYLIVRQEPAFKSGRSLVFSLHKMDDALEILYALNHPEEAAA